MSDKWQLKAVLSAVDNMSPRLKEIAQNAKNTRKYLADVGSSATDLAGRIGLPLGMVTGAFGVGSLAGIKTAVSGFAEFGEHVVTTSRKMGVSMGEFQRLEYVAGQTGVEVEALASSTAKLNAGIADAASGKNKELASIFTKAGISLKGANGQLRSATDLLPELADLFGKNGNAAVRAKLGMALYGKGWQGLVPMLAEGKDGLAELVAEFDKLGLVVEDDALLAGEAFGDQMATLSRVTQSFGHVMAGTLIPALSPLVTRMIQWGVANREVIATKLAKFAEDVANGLASIDWNAVIDGVKGFIDCARSLVGWLGGARNALIALVIVMNIQTIAAMVGLVSGMAKVGWSLYVLAGGPIPAVTGSLGVMNSAMVLANAGGLMLLKTLGLLAVAAAAAAAGYAIGTGINWAIDAATEKLSGGKYTSLGDMAAGDYESGQIDYEEVNRQRAARGAAPIAAPGSNNKSTAQIDVSLSNAPPGTKVDQIKTKGDAQVNFSAVGQRGFAMDGR